MKNIECEISKEDFIAQWSERFLMDRRKNFVAKFLEKDVDKQYRQIKSWLVYSRNGKVSPQDIYDLINKALSTFPLVNELSSREADHIIEKAETLIEYCKSRQS